MSPPLRAGRGAGITLSELATTARHLSPSPQNCLAPRAARSPCGPHGCRQYARRWCCFARSAVAMKGEACDAACVAEQGALPDDNAPPTRDAAALQPAESTLDGQFRASWAAASARHGPRVCARLAVTAGLHTGTPCSAASTSRVSAFVVAHFLPIGFAFAVLISLTWPLPGRTVTPPRARTCIGSSTRSRRSAPLSGPPGCSSASSRRAAVRTARRARR